MNVALADTRPRLVDLWHCWPASTTATAGLPRVCQHEPGQAYEYSAAPRSISTRIHPANTSRETRSELYRPWLDPAGAAAATVGPLLTPPPDPDTYGKPDPCHSCPNPRPTTLHQPGAFCPDLGPTVLQGPSLSPPETHAASHSASSTARPCCHPPDRNEAPAPCALSQTHHAFSPPALQGHVDRPCRIRHGQGCRRCSPQT